MGCICSYINEDGKVGASWLQQFTKNEALVGHPMNQFKLFLQEPSREEMKASNGKEVHAGMCISNKGTSQQGATVIQGLTNYKVPSNSIFFQKIDLEKPDFSFLQRFFMNHYSFGKSPRNYFEYSIDKVARDRLSQAVKKKF